MATLQVKRVPDDLYDAAKVRAAAEGMSLSEMIVRMLRRELMLPSMSDWLERNSRQRGPVRTFDMGKLMDDVKDEIEGA